MFSNIYAENNLNIENNEPEIFKAIDSKDYKKINKLLKNGVSPCIKKITYKKKSILQEYAFGHAISSGDTDTVNLFLPYVNNITKPCSQYFEISLFYAIVNDDTKMIQFLIDNGADVNIPITFSRHETPIQYSLLLQKMNSAKKLIENGATIKKEIGFQSLQFAIKNLDIEVVKFLINNQYNLNFQNKDGNTILHLMAKGIVEENLTSIQMYVKEKKYIKRFPDTYVKAQEQVKRIKKHFNNYPKIAELIIQSGADNNIKNNYGKTALMIANENNIKTMIEVLKNIK